MKIRIKEEFKNSVIRYIVQVKRFLRWKTVSSQISIEDAIKDAKELRKMEEFNRNEDTTCKTTFVVWGVRNQMKLGPTKSLYFFKDIPEYKRGNITKEDIIWNGTEIGRLCTETLFGDLGLEPRKYKITIEKLS